MKHVLTFLFALVLLLSSPVRAAQDSLIKKFIEATAILYSQDNESNLHFACTATAFQKTDVGYLMLTAGHCIDKDANAYFVSWQENADMPFIRAQVLFRSDTSDLAVLGVVTTLDIPSLPIGDEKLLSEGDTVYNVACPTALSKQFFRGSVTSTTLAARESDGPTLGLELPAAPGSSGSAVVDPSQGAIVGVLIQIYPVKDVGGSIITAALPATDIKKALSDFKSGKPSKHDEELELIFGPAPKQ